tara:strand:- start:16357 stop:17121 length:765 start_codon:yes stop_codon:yes gene_type:complete
MKSKITCTVFVFMLNVGLLFGQNKVLHVEYDFFFKDYFPENRQIDLICNHKVSLSTAIRTILYQDVGESTAKPKSFYTLIFKNRDSIISEEELEGQQYIIGEPLNQFKWELTGNTKKILNYVCQEATTHFRGRDYLAYFTTKIPFKVAPWKFNGLPGVTLLICTDDQKIKIEAKNLKITDSSGEIANPFTSMDKLISWDHFVDLRKQEWNKFNNKVSSQLSLTGQNKMLTANPKISPGLRMEIIVQGEGGLDKP